MSDITSTTIKLGKEYEIKMEDRYFLQNAYDAMKGSVVRGLVELITNSDDSYGRLEDNEIKTSGYIQIIINRHYKSVSKIKLLDLAEGMSLDDMIVKLKRAGGLTSGFIETRGKKRGLMGRGAKECMVLGQLKYQSVKGYNYAEIILKKPGRFIPIANRKATSIDRIDLGIKKGNGTLITWEIEPQFKMPSHETLVKNLPKYYSLRDIMSSDNRTVSLIDDNNNKKEIIKYKRPEGNTVFDEVISIPEYPKAKAYLKIYKTEKPIKVESSSPYWEGGILVKSSYAIHDVTSLKTELENNLPYFGYYFGRLNCAFIDDLIIDFEKKEKQGLQHTIDNHIRIISPSRFGLEKSHPFAKALYNEAAKYLHQLIKKDEDEAKHKVKEIENEKTKKRHKKLASEVSKFIKENIEDPDSLNDENYLTSTEIPVGGIRIVPEGLKIEINQQGKFYVYTKPTTDNDDRHVEIFTESDAIQVSTDILGLADRGDGVYKNSITVKGIKEAKKQKIILKWNNIQKNIFVTVISKKVPIKINDFQFEKENYIVKVGKQKIIKVLAKWPEFISGRVKIKIDIENEKYCKIENKNIILDYNKSAKEKYGRRVAAGSIRLKGLKEGGPIVISTEKGGVKISTKLRVLPKKEIGADFEIQIVNEDLGQRSAFIGNLIKINGKHDTIKRYLGPADDFLGQDLVHFRLLEAELIAETVARRVLELIAQQNINEFKDLDVTGFYRKHREYKNKFLKRAHQIQIPESELDEINIQ